MAIFSVSEVWLSKHARTTAYVTMPAHQDRYEISLELVTIAGTVYAMQADLSHYEDVAELEDDILCFLPTEHVQQRSQVWAKPLSRVHEPC